MTRAGLLRLAAPQMYDALVAMMSEIAPRATATADHGPVRRALDAIARAEGVDPSPTENTGGGRV